MTTQQNTFKTDDINLASFIKVQGGKIINVGVSANEEPRENSNFEIRYYFEFSNEEACNKLKYDFLNGEPANAQALFEAREMFVKQVKSLGKGFH